jgi:Tol biopolymer transport system component
MRTGVPPAETSRPPFGWVGRRNNDCVRAHAAAIVLLVGLGAGCSAGDQPATAEPASCPAEIAPTELMEISWAPRSSRVAVSTVERGLFVIDVQTCVVERVRDGGQTYYWSPDWSPDERHLVFARSPGPVAPSKLMISGLHGEKARVLTRGSDDTFPSWSPRGDLIAFTRRADIYVVQTDGRGLRRLTSAGYNVQPDWSPDGKSIAWACDSAICTMDADGSHTRRLFEPSRGGEFGDPAWSPDGRSIAFDGIVSYDPPATLMIGPAQGERVRTFPLLSPEGLRDRAPTWSPDGEQIGFIGNDGTYENLYVVRPDESGLRALTESP